MQRPSFEYTIKKWDNKNLLNVIESLFTYSDKITEADLDYLIKLGDESEESRTAILTALVRELKKRIL